MKVEKTAPSPMKVRAVILIVLVTDVSDKSDKKKNKISQQLYS